MYVVAQWSFKTKSNYATLLINTPKWLSISSKQKSKTKVLTVAWRAYILWFWWLLFSQYSYSTLLWPPLLTHSVSPSVLLPYRFCPYCTWNGLAAYLDFIFSYLFQIFALDTFSARPYFTTLFKITALNSLVLPIFFVYLIFFPVTLNTFFVYFTFLSCIVHLLTSL